MANNNLDDQIRDALGDFKAEFDAGSWGKLSERIAADPELGDEVDAAETFDQTVKTKINSLNPEYQPAHWKIMAERIQQEFSLRRKLIRYKVAEVGMVLFIIFTLFNVFPESTTKIRNKVHNLTERIAKIQSSISNDKQEAVLQKNTAILSKELSRVLTVEISDGNYILKELETIEENLVAVENAIEQNSINSPIAEIPVLENSSAFSGQIESISSLSSVLENEFSFGQTTVFNEDESKPKRGISKVGKRIRALFNKKKAPVDSLEELDDSEISTLEYEPESFEGGESNVPAQIASRFGMRVGMFAGSDYNYIETPYDPVFDLTRNGRFAHGYQSGVALSFRIGEMEIETGGIYSNKEYDPGIPTEYFDALPGPPIIIAFDKIQLNMLEVPLNFRFHVNRNATRWKFYGQTGASLHMALVANYDKFPSNLDALFAGAPPGSTPPPKLESKKFADGLLEGGNFAENSYFTVNLGFGVERALTPRWSLFLQPSMKAYVLPTYNNGLGPNQDRISNISILTGARVSLW